jgi:hypothetical protein
MSEGWLVGLETWNGMRQEEVEVKTRKCAAQTERDTARSADKSRDRQTASQWNVLLPAATAINLEAAGPCLRSSVDLGRDVSGGERKV